MPDRQKDLLSKAVERVKALRIAAAENEATIQPRRTVSEDEVEIFELEDDEPNQQLDSDS